MPKLSTESLSIETIQKALENEKYVSERELATALYLSLKLKKPLLVEGEPGCGKTELAKVLSVILNTDLIRLQCYEGLDASAALYEWDYLRQLLRIKMHEGRGESDIEADIFSEKYLMKRPLLKTVLHESGPVLLIDEIDRADEEFEGFLLEFLGEFQVTIPEIGTLKAKNPPAVVITSNRTRELGDGLRRRCLYLYLTYPSFDKELKITRSKVPRIGNSLAKQVVEFVQKAREFDDVVKRPGVSETLDWASALVALNVDALDPRVVEETLSCLVKSADDVKKFRGERLLSVLGKINGAKSV